MPEPVLWMSRLHWFSEAVSSHGMRTKQQFLFSFIPTTAEKLWIALVLTDAFSG